MANKLSLNVGDIITLLSNNSDTTPFGIIPRQINFVVNYIFSTGMYEFDSNFIITNISQGRLLSKKKMK